MELRKTIFLKMKKNIFFIFLLTFLLALNLNDTYAQKDSLPKTFSFVKNSKGWFSSNNAAGLSHFSLHKVAEVNSFLNKKKGEFVNYYQSNDSYRWGIGTQSFYRFNERVVFYGKIDYQNFTGKNMAGSIFINPGKTPFNIVELSDTTQGIKNREQYRLLGAFSIALINHLYLGIKVDYKTSNYAKHKDLRHRNKQLNLDASLGLSYTFKFLEIGANYLYSRNIEEIYFKIFGNTDRQYMHLIDFGNFYGRYELYSDSGDGYISGWGAKPLASITHTYNLQLNIKLSEQLSFFNELGFGKNAGHFGTDESNSIVYTTHKANNLNYKGIFTYAKENNLQRLAIELNTNTLMNYENAYRRNTLPGQLSEIEYLGKVKMFERNKLGLNINYIGYLDIHKFGSKWLFKSYIKASEREQKTSIFPFYRKQKITFFESQLGVERTFFQENRQWSLGLGISYAKGLGKPFSETMRGSISANTKTPKSTEFNLFREYEYYTLARINPQFDVSYGKLIKNKMLAYVRLAYSFTYAFDNEHIKGNYLQMFELKIGVDF